MEATTKYISNKSRWDTGLLWKYDKINMPDSYLMALKRLKCLKAKMLKDPKLKTFLSNTMQHYEEKRYIRKLEKWELSNSPHSWYFPIFTVTNPNKNKTRLVWDAAPQVDGISLNDTILKGSDMLMSLMGMLLRFRERPIAVSGDIRKLLIRLRFAPKTNIPKSSYGVMERLIAHRIHS